MINNKKLFFLISIYLLGFLLLLEGKEITFLTNVEIDPVSKRINFIFTDDNYQYQVKDLPYQTLITFLQVRSRLKWNYKLIKSEFFSFIRMYQIGYKVKFIVGKKKEGKVLAKKVGKVTLLGFHASNFKEEAPFQKVDTKTKKVPSFLEAMEVKQYAKGWGLLFKGENLPRPKIIEDQQKLVLIWNKTIETSLPETTLLYKGPFKVVKSYRLKNGMRHVVVLKNTQKYQLQQRDNGWEILFSNGGEEEKDFSVVDNLQAKSIGDTDYLLLEGKNLDKIEIVETSETLILKGKVLLRKNVLNAQEKFNWIKFLREIKDQKQYRLVLVLKDKVKNFKIAVEKSSSKLKLRITKEQPKKVPEKPYSKKIGGFIRRIYLQEKGAKTINVELDKPYKFKLLRGDNLLIVNFYGVEKVKEVPLEKFDNPILSGFRIIKGKREKEAKLLLFLATKGVEPIYLWKDSVTLSIKFEDKDFFKNDFLKKEVSEDKKQDNLGELISKLKTSVEKQSPIEKKSISSQNVKGVSLKKIIFQRVNPQFMDLSLVLSEPVAYKKVITPKQVIVFFKGHSLLPQKTYFFYKGPVQLVRILEHEDLLRVVVVLSYEIIPQFINTEDGIILRFPVEEKKKDNKVIQEKEKATIISLPSAVVPSQDMDSEGTFESEEIDDFSLAKVSQSLAEVKKKRKVEKLYVGALAKIKLQDYIGAYSDVKKALELSPYDDRLLQLLNQIKPLYRVSQYIKKGQDYAKNNRWTEAIFAYREALNFDPENVKARYLLEEAEKMKELYDQYFRAKIFYENRNFPEAKKILENLLRIKSDFKEGLYLLGKVFEDENKFKMALKYFEKGKELYPVDRDFQLSCERVKLKERIKDLYEEGKKYEQKKDWDRALLKYQQAVELQNELKKFTLDHTLRYLKDGYAAYLRQDLEAAETYFKKVIAIDFENVKAHYWLGKVYMDMGKVSLAAKEFKIVSQLDPQNKITNFEVSEVTAATSSSQENEENKGDEIKNE